MSDVHRRSRAAVIVNWEPVLHLAQWSWHGHEAYSVETVAARCGQIVTGTLDDAEKHVVTCLTCLVKTS